MNMNTVFELRDLKFNQGQPRIAVVPAEQGTYATKPVHRSPNTVLPIEVYTEAHMSAYFVCCSYRNT